MHCMLGLGNVLGRWLCAPSGFPDWRGQGVSWARGIETANPSDFLNPGTDGDVAQLRGSIHDLHDTSNIQQSIVIHPCFAPGGL